MNGNFYTVNKMTNNIESQEYFPIQQSISNNNNIFANTLSKENIDEYDGIEEVPEKKDYYPQNQNNYRLNGNSFFLFNNKINNGLNSNTFQNYSFNNTYSSGNILNRANSSEIVLPKPRNELILDNSNLYQTQNLFNKRNVSEDKFTPIRQTQSKYSSLSENKYHFMNRINLNPKFGFTNFTDNNNTRINYAPIDVTKSFNNLNINGITIPININNLNNSGENIYTYENNVKNTYSNLYTNQGKNGTYIYGINNVQNNNNERGNRFLNNKLTSNYSYNTINYGTLQNSFLQKMNPVIVNKPMNNNIISNFDIVNNNTFEAKKSAPIINTQYYKKIQNFNNLNNNNTINNDLVENQRLTVAHKNINKNKSPFIVTKIQKKEPEIAKVTKISSIHTTVKNNDFNNINNNMNNLGNNNINLNPINKTMTSFNPINNNINPIKNSNQFIINNMNIILNNKRPITNKKVNQNKKTNNIPKTNKKINKTQNKIVNQPPNVLINQELNINTSPQKINPKLASNYKTGTNTILTHYNFNINNQNQFINQTNNNNEKNNDNKNDDEKSQPDIPKEKKDESLPKENANRGIDVRYNDFDGSGLVKNYGGVTRPGKDVAGKIKTNQDAIVCLTNINNIKNFNMFGVLDGHGPDGHFVSEFMSDFIPSKLINNPEIKALSDCEEIYKKYKENNCKIITQAFLDADKQLEKVQFDALESGTTCCLIIHIGKHIMCANTGDSRALVVFDSSNNPNPKNLDYLREEPLSIDYKPDLPEESERIIMAGGVVEPMTDEFGQGVGPLRVWAKNEDYPGLAMSRSIGDLRGKAVGVIPDPGILEYDINNSTRFVIACSDGVWEYFDNDTVKDFGKKFYLDNNASGYCHNLVGQAYNEWEKNDQFVDDISAVVAFF